MHDHHVAGIDPRTGAVDPSAQPQTQGDGSRIARINDVGDLIPPKAAADPSHHGPCRLERDAAPFGLRDDYPTEFGFGVLLGMEDADFAKVFARLAGLDTKGTVAFQWPERDIRRPDAARRRTSTARALKILRYETSNHPLELSGVVLVH